MLTQRQQDLAYWKIIDTIEHNPFETTVCGTPVDIALTAVTIFLQEQGVDIPFLDFINYPEKRGAEFKKTYDAFIASLKSAKVALDNDLTKKIAAGTEKNPEILPQVINNNAVLAQLVSEYEQEILKTLGEDHISKKSAWVKTVAFRRPLVVVGQTWEEKKIGDKSKKDILASELLKIRAAQQEEELQSEWSSNIKTYTQNVSQKIAPQISPSQHQAVDKIISEAFRQESADETKTWEDLSFSTTALLGGREFTAQEFDKKKQEIQTHYQQRIEIAVKNDPALQQQLTPVQISQIVQQATADTDSLAELSYIKHVANVVRLPDMADKQGKITGVLLGKILIGLDGANQGTILTPKEKNQQGEAILNALMDVLSRDEKLDQQKINGILQDHVGPRLTVPQTLDLTQEVQVLKAAKLQEAAQTGHIEEKDYYYLPIPGLTFLNPLMRTDVIANTNLFKALRSKNLDETFESFRLEYFKNLQTYKAGLKTLQDPNIDAKTRKLTMKELQKLQKEGFEIVEDPENYLLHSIGIYSERGREKRLSFEEVALAKQFLNAWQKAAKTPILGTWIKTVASLNSLQYGTFGKIISLPLTPFNLISNNTLGRIPIVGKYFKDVFTLPNAFAWSITKSALSVAVQDPTYLPLVTFNILWGVTKQSLSLRGKSIWAALIDTGAKGVVSLFDKLHLGNQAKPIIKSLKNILYFRSHGMTYTIFDSILNPKHYFKEVGKKLIEKAAQFFVSTTVKLVARVGGQAAAETLLVALGGAGAMVVPVVGQILAILGIGKLIWDFLVPQFIKDFIKQIIKWGAAIMAWFWFNVFLLLIKFIGWGGLIGGLLGLMLGGPVGGLIGTVLGMGVGSFLEIIWGVHGAGPIWIQSIFPASWPGIVPGVFKGIFSIVDKIGEGIESLGKTMGYLVAGSMGGTAIVSLMIINFTASIAWVPMAPAGAGTGAQLSKNIRVTKTVTVNSSNCDMKKRHCENTVLDENPVFHYEIIVSVDPGKSFENIVVTDELTILAQGPGFDKPPHTYQIADETGQTKRSVTISKLPDGGSNARTITYGILFDKKIEYQNSLVTNTVVVTAAGETTKTSFSFAIGTPPAERCPAKSVTINCGSLGGVVGTVNDCQHGTDKYWKEAIKMEPCSINIPALGAIKYGNDTYGGVMNNCYRPTPIGSAYYGFAADLGLHGDQSVYFPAVEGDYAVWTKYLGPQENGSGGLYGYSMFYHGEGQKAKYNIFVTHLDLANIQDNGISGGYLGTIYGGNPMGAHLHYEVSKITSSGEEFLRPDIECQ